ncbi:MAG: hypothetical protein D4R84_14435 [Rhodocyclaceae bacterium]|nr:MAG: hypothetical protein D4R84_14435 [Rhodocyclaceae bacterium]
MSRPSVTILSILFAAIVTLASGPTALAASDCEAKAIDKNGKPLAGAAKASSIKKCEGEAKSAASDCEAKAVSKNGKPLAGAAKAASIKKCEGDAKGSK